MIRRNPWILPAFGSSLALIGLAFFGREVRLLRTSVSEARGELQALRERLAAERDERAALEARAVDLGRRANELEGALAQARAALLAAGEDAGALLRRLEERTAASESRSVALGAEVEASARRVDALGQELAGVRRRVDAIAPDDFSDLLAPTVKIASKSDVGSGTVVYSAKEGPQYVSYVLTAYHIVEQNWDLTNPIPLDVITFQEGRKVREESGVVVSASPELDLALIEVRTERGFDAVARMISPDRAAGVKLYARVHAIGCPLGYAPIPTSGEITSKSKVLDGQSYWMINAPTIFGNSGGGIYLADTGEMIGILSRISAYKNLIDVAVPHMGIVVSMPDVYRWLEREHYQFIYDGHYTYEQCGRARLAEKADGRGRKAPVSTSVRAGATATEAR
jgi:hypothetical protein